MPIFLGKVALRRIWEYFEVASVFPLILVQDKLLVVILDSLTLSKSSTTTVFVSSLVKVISIFELFEKLVKPSSLEESISS